MVQLCLTLVPCVFSCLPLTRMTCSVSVCVRQYQGVALYLTPAVNIPAHLRLIHSTSPCCQPACTPVAHPLIKLLHYNRLHCVLCQIVQFANATVKV